MLYSEGIEIEKEKAIKLIKLMADKQYTREK